MKGVPWTPSYESIRMTPASWPQARCNWRSSTGSTPSSGRAPLEAEVAAVTSLGERARASEPEMAEAAVHHLVAAAEEPGPGRSGPGELIGGLEGGVRPEGAGLLPAGGLVRVRAPRLTEDLRPAQVRGGHGVPRGTPCSGQLRLFEQDAGILTLAVRPGGRVTDRSSGASTCAGAPRLRLLSVTGRGPRGKRQGRPGHWGQRSLPERSQGSVPERPPARPSK